MVAPLFAHAQTATLTGTVIDATGASVAGASVTARNTGIGTTRSATTGAIGVFALPDLVPGEYRVTVEKTGFATLDFRNIVLTVDQVQTLNARLQLTPVNETVTVNAALPTIDLDSSSISNVVTANEISQLPLLLRNPYTLVLLSPGVIQTNAAVGGSVVGGYSANGARERDNNFLLDGVDNNDANVPGTPGGMSAINPDSTQEFRVITSDFAADVGRNDGAFIDIVTTRGTNTLHGDAYFFGRYAALGARDFFASSKNPYTRNIFGSSVGGPIRHDRLFFFANYEGHRFLTTLTNSSTVPTEAFKTGIFTYDGTSINVSTPGSANNANGLPLDPAIQKLLALYPAPNGAAVDDIRGTLNFPSTSHDVNDNVTTRIDANLNARNALAVRYVLNQDADPNPYHYDFLPGDIGAVGARQRAQNLGANFTTTLSPTLINQLRAGANRSSEQYYCDNLPVMNQFGPLDQFGRGTDFELPGISGFGCIQLGDSDGQAHHIGTYSVGDSLTWVAGPHTIKFGGEYRGVYFNGFNDFFSRPTVNLAVFSNVGIQTVSNGPSCPDGCVVLQDMVGMLQGLVYSQFQYQFFNSVGNPASEDLRGYRQREFAFYSQDSWKARPNLVLNYGLRWEYFGVPYEVHSNLSNLYVPADGLAPFTFEIVGPGGPSLYHPNTHDFGPRVGFAWDPFKTGRTSVRGGFGIFYDRAYDNLFGNAAGNPPFEQQFFAAPNGFSPSGYTGTTFSTLSSPTQLTSSPTVNNGAFESPVIIDPNLKNPSSLNWSLGVQREITRKLTFEANYIGRKGTHLYNVVNANQPNPTLVANLVAQCNQGPDPSACIASLQYGSLYYYAVYNNAFYYPTEVESAANSIYNGLQTKTTLQPWHGLRAQLSYTYSHAIDDASDPLRPAVGNDSYPVNSFDLRAERGNSDCDIRNVAVLNFVYAVPVGRGASRWNSGFLGRALEGWSVGAIATFQGGLPFDIFGDLDSQHTGMPARATIIGNPQQPPGTDKTFTGPALSAFEETPFGQVSNLSRNRFYGPGLNNWDTVFIKNTPLTERASFQLRFEFYNLFNRTDFAQPDNNIADTGTFGESLQTLVRPDGTTSARQIQIGAKISF